jgi:RecA-family ATPase
MAFQGKATSTPAGVKTDERILPQRTLDYLRFGAAEGQRNAELYSAAQQFRDAGYAEAEAQSDLSPRAHSDGLLPGEISRTIASAYEGEQREPIGAGLRRPSVTTYQKAAPPKIKFRKVETEAEQLPDHLENGWKQLLETAFKLDEYVSIAGTFEDEDGRHVPERGVTDTAKGWIEYFEKLDHGVASYEGKHGLFVRINPMQKGGSKNDEVVSFRHCLVEADKGPKEDQYGALLKIGLPIAAIIDSAGKSVHAWVRVDAKDREEYNKRVELIYQFCEDSLGLSGFDKQNRNPSRYSRMPDGRRMRVKDGEPVLGENGKPIIDMQRLLAVNVPGKPWDQWRGELTALQERSYQRFDLDDLISFRPADDPDCLLGNRWLGRGGTFVLTGEPGHGKTSLTIAFLSKWALGLPAFGIVPDRPLRCVIIQAENDKGDMAEPLCGQVDYKGLDAEERNLLKNNLIILQDSEAAGPKFAAAIKNVIEDFKPDVVVSDPLMAYAGCDLSKQEQMADFLYNTLNPIIKESGIIFGFVHHDRKPPAQMANGRKPESRAMHNLLGSIVIAAWAREVISLVCTDEKNKQFELHFGKRGSRTGVGSVIRIRHTKQEGVVRWEQMGVMEGTATGPSRQDKHAKMESALRTLLENERGLGKSTVHNYAKKNGWSKEDAWNYLHSLADGENYYLVEVVGHPHVSKDPHFGRIDPDADKKKVLAFIEREKIVSKNKLDQWAESDPALPSGDKAIKLADMMFEDGEIRLTEKFKFPGNNASCKVYSIEDPHSYKWVNGKPVTPEAYQENENESEVDPFA